MFSFRYIAELTANGDSRKSVAKELAAIAWGVRAANHAPAVRLLRLPPYSTHTETRVFDAQTVLPVRPDLNNAGKFVDWVGTDNCQDNHISIDSWIQALQVGARTCGRTCLRSLSPYHAVPTACVPQECLRVKQPPTCANSMRADAVAAVLALPSRLLQFMFRVKVDLSNYDEESGAFPVLVRHLPLSPPLPRSHPTPLPLSATPPSHPSLPHLPWRSFHMPCCCPSASRGSFPLLAPNGAARSRA